MEKQLWMLLEDVLDNIEDARNGLCARGPALTGEQRTIVQEHVQTALERIGQALGAIGDAGAAAMDHSLQTVNEVMDLCVRLARSALREREEVWPSPNRIGDQLKTIESLIKGNSNGLGTLAGID